MKSRQDAH